LVSWSMAHRSLGGLADKKPWSNIARLASCDCDAGRHPGFHSAITRRAMASHMRVFGIAGSDKLWAIDRRLETASYGFLRFHMGRYFACRHSLDQHAGIGGFPRFYHLNQGYSRQDARTT